MTPTGASWINQVERVFADLTQRRIGCGVHRSTPELEAAIKTYNDSAQEKIELTSESEH
ncbi:MAG: hypothetical protein Kilf2KO_49140 [Rhodospirillales bacterium]